MFGKSAVMPLIGALLTLQVIAAVPAVACEPIEPRLILRDVFPKCLLDRFDWDETDRFERDDRCFELDPFERHPAPMPFPEDRGPEHFEFPKMPMIQD